MEETTIIAVVERIEKNVAVLETENYGSFTVPKNILPQKLNEGNVLRISFKIDPELESERRKRIRDLQNS